MKTICDEIKIVTDTLSPVYEKDKNYNKMREYLLEMKKEGLLNPVPYSIPALDTIGKRLHQQK